MIAPAMPIPGRTAGLPEIAGFAWGFLAAAIWGAYLAFARAGVVGGLAPLDFALLRYATAGLVMLPVLLRMGLGGLGWGRAMVLTMLAGPLFMMLAAGGYLYAPLAHGAVVQPAAVTVGTMLLAVLLLGERIALPRWMGAGLVLLGLAIVAGGFAGMPGAWRGDLAFAGAGLLWAAFTVACRVWRVDPLRATAIVGVLGGIAILPAWVVFGDPEMMLAQGGAVLATQALVQGLLSGVVAVFAYGRAVARLGAARAAVFAAMVPALAILSGIPIAGEWPSAGQWAGLGVVLTGLVLAMGVLGRR